MEKQRLSGKVVWIIMAILVLVVCVMGYFMNEESRKNSNMERQINLLIQENEKMEKKDTILPNNEVELYQIQMNLTERKENLTKQFNVPDTLLFHYGKYDEIEDQTIMQEIKLIDAKIIEVRDKRNEIERKKYKYKYASEKLGL